MNGPSQALLEAFLRRIQPTIKSMREEGWPMEVMVTGEKDGTLSVSVTSELSMKLVPVEALPEGHDERREAV